MSFLTNTHVSFHNKVPSAAAAGAHGSYAASIYCSASEVVDLFSLAEHIALYESEKLYTDSSGFEKNTLEKMWQNLSCGLNSLFLCRGASQVLKHRLPLHLTSSKLVLVTVINRFLYLF